MGRRYIHPVTGESLQYPDSREAAKKSRFKRYKDGSTCPVCNTQSTRYTATTLCHRCQFFKSTALHALVHADHLWNHNELTCHVEYKGKPYKFSDEVYMELLEMKWRMDDDKSLRAHSLPCKEAGHLHVTRSGRCIECHEKPSPRKEAIEKGEDWYTPNTPCLHCNTISLKRVNNGQCQGCTPSTIGESPRDAAKAKGKATYIGRACVKCSFDVRLTETGRCARCEHD